MSVINGSYSGLAFDATKVIPTSFQRINGLDVAYVQGLDDASQYYVMVESASVSKGKNNTIPEFSSEFVIKVEYVKSVMAGFITQFRAGNGGLIEYEPLKYQRGHFKFAWSPVVTLRKGGPLNQDISYKVVTTKNPRVNLD